MSVTTLSRFSVPIDGQNQGTLMPKLAYRFRVFLENFGVSRPSSELTKQVVDVARPNISFEPIVVDVYNSKINLAGRHTWDPITLTIRDDATGAVSKLIGEQLQKQFDFYEQASARAGIDYKFTTRIEMLDGGNGAFEANVLETWELYGCFVQSANYNSLAYSTNDVVTISMNIQFDNAIQTELGTGVGTNVGRTLGALSTGAGAANG